MDGPLGPIWTRGREGADRDAERFILRTGRRHGRSSRWMVAGPALVVVLRKTSIAANLSRFDKSCWGGVTEEQLSAVLKDSVCAVRCGTVRCGAV